MQSRCRAPKFSLYSWSTGDPHVCVDCLPNLPILPAEHPSVLSEQHEIPSLCVFHSAWPPAVDRGVILRMYHVASFSMPTKTALPEGQVLSCERLASLYCTWQRDSLYLLQIWLKMSGKEGDPKLFDLLYHSELILVRTRFMLHCSV